MSAAELISAERPASGGYERWLFHVAWAVGVAIFHMVGSLTLRPVDPHGPVSLLTIGHPWRMVAEVLALAIVVGAIATLIAGRWFPDMGAFAVGLGLGVVALHGDNMTYLLMRDGGGRSICLSLIGEALLWSALMAAAMLASAFVARWFEGETSAGSRDADDVVSIRGRMAAAGAPGVGRALCGGIVRDDVTDRRTGVRHLALVVIVALVLISVFSSGRGDRAIRHGQACFAVVAAFYVATNRAQMYFATRSTFWACAAVPVVCLLAYGISWIRAHPSVLVDNLASVPVSNYLRILPITYVAFGVPAVLLAHWRATRRHGAEE